jgi:AP-3 complex subunit mu
MGDSEHAVFVQFSSSRVVHIKVSNHYCLFLASPSLPTHLISLTDNSAKIARPAHAFRIRFEIHQHSFSALKVDQLRLTGEGYKPYKGVRGRSVGDVEWRW